MITLNNNKNKCLTIRDNNKNDGALTEIRDCANLDNQKYQLVNIVQGTGGE